jgi:pimeloyl-ACP methyl ester carboxylesterase
MGPPTMSQRGLPPQSAGPLVHAQLTVGVVDRVRVAGGVERGGLGCGQVQLAGHSDLGSALTMRGVQAARPSLYALTDELAKVRIPVLVLVGDEDDGCLEPALMLKRTIPTSGLAVLPRTGHTANLEEPDVFNQAVDRFLAAVARGAWHPRDPRSVSDSTMGLR